MAPSLKGILASAAGVGCLRFPHLQRYHSLSIQGDLLCGERPPFPWSAPATRGAFDLGDRVLTDWREMQERSSVLSFIIPDLAFGKHDPLSAATPRLLKKMSINKVAAMLQALFSVVVPSRSLESP